MKLNVSGNTYDIIIERKSTTRNTYIRVKPDLSILVTTNKFTSIKTITDLIEENYEKIVKMIEVQQKKNENNDGFFYLGKHYDIIYVDTLDISFGENKVFLGRNFDIDKWYKKQAKKIFLEHLNEEYNKFSRKIPYPELKIRKMTSRWGVCNIKLKTITLNLELMKRDTKYLDYVIVHELSHLVHADHSDRFWSLVEENMPDYKKYRKEMKEF
mgnify:FL=1